MATSRAALRAQSSTYLYVPEDLRDDPELAALAVEHSEGGIPPQADAGGAARRHPRPARGAAFQGRGARLRRPVVPARRPLHPRRRSLHGVGADGGRKMNATVNEVQREAGDKTFPIDAMNFDPVMQVQLLPAVTARNPEAARENLRARDG
jgi:hypothetical protein